MSIVSSRLEECPHENQRHLSAGTIFRTIVRTDVSIIDIPGICTYLTWLFSTAPTRIRKVISSSSALLAREHCCNFCERHLLTVSPHGCEHADRLKICFTAGPAYSWEYHIIYCHTKSRNVDYRYQVIYQHGSSYTRYSLPRYIPCICIPYHS